MDFPVESYSIGHPTKLARSGTPRTHARMRLPIYHIIILRLATLSEIFNQIKIHTFKTSMKTKNILTTTENKLKGAVSLRAHPGET